VRERRQVDCASGLAPGANGRLLTGFGAVDSSFSDQTVDTITTPAPGLTDLSITDVDRDGRADIVVADHGNGVIRITRWPPSR
jgi:hypothetical protein